MNKIEKSITLAQAAPVVGLTVQSLRARIKKDPSFPAYQLDGGHFRVIAAELDRWIEQQRSKRHTAWKASAAAKGHGAYEIPEAVAAADANDDLRFILRVGHEREGRTFWRNASRLGGDAPADIAVALGLAPSVAWSRVVEKVEQLLGLPHDKRKIALAFVAKRQAEFFEGTVDPLHEDVEVLA